MCVCVWGGARWSILQIRQDEGKNGKGVKPKLKE